MRLKSLCILALFLAVAYALPAAGDVFNMPSGLTSLETVPVGDPGNAGDSRYAFNGIHGAVGYSYSIGKYEVTAGQYCQFLNAVAATDAYGLYNPQMASGPYACNIVRGVDSGGYTYSVAADWANRPVNYVSYWDACRFTNWLGNGQPSGPQGTGTTETGAYTLAGYNGEDGGNIVRNPNATWALPTEDEWYKAAYYKAGGLNAGYWTYPTRSDTAPSNVVDPSGTNNGNFRTPDGLFAIGAPYYRTEAGAFAASPGPYGTFDQGGNVMEWNEYIYQQFSGFSARGIEGGSFLDRGTLGMDAGFGTGGGVASEVQFQGFRVVQVPEPGCVTVVLLGVLAFKRRRRERDVYPDGSYPDGSPR